MSHECNALVYGIGYQISVILVAFRYITQSEGIYFSRGIREVTQVNDVMTFVYATTI